MLAPPPLPRNLEASFRDLDSQKPAMRASAIADVVRHARDSEEVRARAVPLLERRLTDAAANVRAAAAVALADLVAREAIAALLVAVEDDDAHVREMALSALGELGDVRALPRLRRALTDARPEMRYQAILAFARLGDDDAELERALVHATHDEDEAVGHIALRLAEERVDAGKPAGDALATRARALLDAGSPAQATVAAILLGKTGDAAGHALLLRVVRGEKIRGVAPEKEDERAAVELVGVLGLEGALPHLQRRAWGVMHFVRDTCAFHAKIALARMGDPRATSEILRDLESPRPDVLGGAVVSAGRARLRQARARIAALPEGRVDPELRREALKLLDEDENVRTA